MRLAVASSAPRPRPALRTDRPAASAASRSRPAATVATRAACATGKAWLPTPRHSAANANSHTVPGLAGAASSSAVPITRTSMAAATAVLRARPVQPAAHRGGAAEPRDRARRHRETGDLAGNRSTSMPYRSRNGRSNPVTERVHGEGDGVARATGGSDESVEAGIPGLRGGCGRGDGRREPGGRGHEASV